MARRAARKDGNHNEIADGLRALGWYVMDLSRAGMGVPDILVGKPATAIHRGVVIPCEIKQPGKALTPKETDVRKAWEPCSYLVVTSLEDALEQLSKLLERHS